jgi:hypothetical protein
MNVDSAETSRGFVSVEDVDAGGNVLNQPVETLEQTLAAVRAAPHDLPVPVLVHHFKVQNLKSTTNKN